MPSTLFWLEPCAVVLRSNLLIYFNSPFNETLMKSGPYGNLWLRVCGRNIGSTSSVTFLSWDFYWCVSRRSVFAIYFCGSAKLSAIYQEMRTCQMLSLSQETLHELQHQTNHSCNGLGFFFFFPFWEEGGYVEFEKSVAARLQGGSLPLLHPPQ